MTIFKPIVAQCRGVQLSHCPTSVRQGLQNVLQTKNWKHCLTGNFSENMTNWARYISWIFLIQIVFKNQWTLLSDAVNWDYELVLVLTIAIWAYTGVPPGDNIHSYYRTTVTKNCCAPGPIDCAPGLKNLDTPDSAHKHFSVLQDFNIWTPLISVFCFWVYLTLTAAYCL